MSFVLPGNARSLRFTGEAKALAPKSDSPQGQGIALGKPRVRKPPPPPVVTPQPTARVHTPVPPPATRVQTPAHHMQTRVPTPLPSSRDIYRPSAVPTPYVGSINAPAARQPFESLDDENATMAMDRDALDVLPGGGVRRTQKPVASVAPIPHFRPAMVAPATIVPHTASNSIRTGTGAPLAVWVFAGLLAAVISFYVAPEIMARFDSPARATTSER